MYKGLCGMNYDRRIACTARRDSIVPKGSRHDNELKPRVVGPTRPTRCPPPTTCRSHITVCTCLKGSVTWFTCGPRTTESEKGKVPNELIWPSAGRRRVASDAKRTIFMPDACNQAFREVRRGFSESAIERASSHQRGTVWEITHRESRLHDGLVKDVLSVSWMMREGRQPWPVRPSASQQHL